MVENNNSPESAWRVPEWFPDLDKSVLEKLREYHKELIAFNKKINLVSSRTEADSDAIHIADAILAAKLILNHTKKNELYDIGSGNGIPGIIIAAMAPKRTVRLVDSDTRKIEFLKHCISHMGLKNCFAIHARVEDLGADVLHCGVCRGFANLARTLLLLRKVAASGCELFHMKGETWTREAGELPAQLLASWEPQFLGEYILPKTNAKLSVVLTIRK